MKSSSLDALQWYEGMLLSPQLLQQSDIYQQNVRDFLLRYIYPYYYGVQELEIDLAKLSSGLLQVSNLQVTFQDGLVYTTSASDSTDLSVDLSPYKDTLSKTPQIISLVLPSYNPTESNVSGDYPRFLSEAGSQAVDINTGENKIEFPRLRGNVSLLVGDVPARYTSIPIAKVAMNQDTYVLSPDFIPSFVKLPQKSAIAQDLKAIIDKMRGKINFLYQKQDAYQNSYDNTSDSTQQNLTSILQYLSSSLLQIEALYYSDMMQPFELYKSLCALAGNLAPLKPDQILPFFGEYKHEDQYASFSKPISFINTLLDLLQKSFESMDFLQKGRFFTIALQDDWITGDSFYVGIKLSSSVSETQGLSWLNEAVIATDDCVKTVRDNRILGAARKVLDGGSQSSLTVPKDVTLLQIKNDSKYITANRVLTIFNISDTEETRPLSIILYVPKENTKSSLQKDSTTSSSDQSGITSDNNSSEEAEPLDTPSVQSQNDELNSKKAENESA